MPPKSKKASAGDAANHKVSAPKADLSKDNGDVDVKAAPHGKPDQAVYHAEQDAIKIEIEAVQAKLTAIKEKIALTSKTGPGNDKKEALRAELDSIRTKQSTGKASRSRLFEQLKSIQDAVQKKVKDLQTASAKVPFKNVAEVDAQIKNLEKQVESGSMKLGDEKRALQEISSLKRSRKTVESFQVEQAAIDAERARADELRKQLDDPEAKAMSERFDTIRAELDELKKESDESFAGRNKLYDERNALSAELDALYTRKRESAQKHREAGDRYWQKVNEERARRAERLKAQRVAEEEEKRRQVAERLLEEARTPAFQSKIEDCQTLIGYLSARIAGGNAPVPAPTSLSTSSQQALPAGVAKLEFRQVEQNVEGGLVQRKKKGEGEESYFVGGKGRGGKKGTGKGVAARELNLPLATLSALTELAIPPPASAADLPRAVEDLKTKKAWFEANQEKVTAEHISKAEAEVKRLAKEDGALANGHASEPPATESAAGDGVAAAEA